MTKQNILQELGNCIQSSLKNEITRSTTNIALFLLGEPIEDESEEDIFTKSEPTKNESTEDILIENTHKTLSNSFAYKIYKGERSLSAARINKLITLPDDKWDIMNSYIYDSQENDKKHILQLYNYIRELFSKYFPDSPSKLHLPIGTMIHSLVLLHFTGTDEEFILFNSKNIASHALYIPWKAKETRLCRLLESNNIVFVTGQPASGKTQLVRYCVHHLGNWKNVFWLDKHPGIPLADRIQYIDFIDENGTPSAEAESGGNISPMKDEDILDTLEQKTAVSLLVIDIPFMKDNDYSFINEHLTDMELRIIITTRTTAVSRPFVSINLDKRPVKNLMMIFREYCPHKLLTDKDFRKLCQTISHNPFIMTLIAKCFRKDPKKFNLTKLLDTESWHLNVNPKIHASYQSGSKKSELSVKTLAARILEDYDEEFLKTAGSKLSILAKNDIPQSVLEEEISTEDISKAIDLDLLQYTDHKNRILRMPAIIADIIWQQYPINYKDYQERIFQNLKYISEGQELQQTYRFLYEHTVTMIYRFHFQMTELKTRPSKKDKAAFMEWNHILSEIIQQFIQLGNIRDAQNILYRLYVYEDKDGTKEDLVPSCKLLDRKIFQLHIDFVRSSSPVDILEQTIHLLLEITSQMETFPKQRTQFLFLLEKLYIFITDIIEDLLLKQFVLSLTPSPDAAKLLNNTINVLRTFLEKNPKIAYKSINDSKHKDTYEIDRRIFSYYKMHYYYLSYTRDYSILQNLENANKHLNILIDLDPDFDISFKACLWKLCYDMIILSNNSDNLKPSSVAERLDDFAFKFIYLYKTFHNRVCSISTSVLFYYCSILTYVLLPYSYPYTLKLIRTSLAETYDLIIAQSTIFKKKTEYPLDTPTSIIDALKELKTYPIQF